MDDNVAEEGNTNSTGGTDTSEAVFSSTFLSIFYCYASLVLVLGLLSNLVALWCVIKCKNTQRGAKVLLGAIFTSTLLLSLIMPPFGTLILIFPEALTHGVGFVVDVLTEVLTITELLCIATISFLRALAVWSNKRRHTTIKLALLLLLAIIVYSTIVTTFAERFLERRDQESKVARGQVAIAFNVVNLLLPLLVTLACYIAMMVAIQHNKHRMARTQHSKEGGNVMDQATRAMLAVFVNNVVLGIPHAVSHFIVNDIEDGHATLFYLMHIIFYIHLVTDSILFVRFNQGHRNRVKAVLRKAWFRLPCRNPEQMEASFTVYNTSSSSTTRTDTTTDTSV